MAARKALVLGADGLEQQLQSGDSVLTGANAIFVTPAPVALPAVTLLAPSSVTLTSFTPRVAGDTLAAGEPITVTPSAALPGGLNVSYAIVSAPNTVVIGLASTVSIALGSSVSWTVVAHR